MMNSMCQGSKVEAVAALEETVEEEEAAADTAEEAVEEAVAEAMEKEEVETASARNNSKCSTT